MNSNETEAQKGEGRLDNLAGVKSIPDKFFIL